VRKIFFLNLKDFFSFMKNIFLNEFIFRKINIKKSKKYFSKSYFSRNEKIF